MRKLILLLGFTIIFQALRAQSNAYGQTKIRVTYNDAGDHSFLIDVDILQDDAVIKYIAYDSIRFENVRRDPKYQDINKNINSYKSDDPKSKLAWDTLAKIFERHRGYTRDSQKVNLKKDLIYRNLLNRIITASKDELSPDVNANNQTPGMYIITTDEGTNFNLVIVTPTGKRSIPAHLPTADDNPLLFQFLKSSLGKKPNSATVKNILRNYSWYK